MSEEDVTTVWRKLFRGQEITDLVLLKAEALLDELSPESPLRRRLASELDELQKLHDEP